METNSTSITRCRLCGEQLTGTNERQLFRKMIQHQMGLHPDAVGKHKQALLAIHKWLRENEQQGGIP